MINIRNPERPTPNPGLWVIGTETGSRTPTILATTRPPRWEIAIVISAANAAGHPCGSAL